MSPEQEREASHLRPSADVYAWAATIFELLTLRQVRNVPPGTRAASLRADVPPWLDDLLARCLADAPAERPWDWGSADGGAEEGRGRIGALGAERRERRTEVPHQGRGGGWRRNGAANGTARPLGHNGLEAGRGLGDGAAGGVRGVRYGETRRRT